MFIASEVMLFGALFSSYALLRVAAVDWPAGASVLNVQLGWTNTVLLMVLTFVAIRARRTRPEASRGLLWVVSATAVVFLAIKGFEYRAEWQAGQLPATSTFMAMYYTLTGVHALHVAGGIMANLWVISGARSVGTAMTAGRLTLLARYWIFVDLVWLVTFAALYLS